MAPHPSRITVSLVGEINPTSIHHHHDRHFSESKSKGWYNYGNETTDWCKRIEQDHSGGRYTRPLPGGHVAVAEATIASTGTDNTKDFPIRLSKRPAPSNSFNRSFSLQCGSDFSKGSSLPIAVETNQRPRPHGARFHLDKSIMWWKGCHRRIWRRRYGPFNGRLLGRYVRCDSPRHGRRWQRSSQRASQGTNAGCRTGDSRKIHLLV